MPICSKCGSELDPNWKLCPHCGQGTTINVIIERKPSTRRYIIWISAFIIISGSIFLYFYFTHTNLSGEHTYNIEILILGAIPLVFGLIIPIAYILYKHKIKSKS